MDKVTKGMKAKDALKIILSENHVKAIKGKEEGKLVAWCTSVSPREFLEAMDVVTVYPEYQAAGIAIRKGSVEKMALAENVGYSMDLCSYARVNFGYVEAGISGPFEAPFPDFLVCCNNICNTVTKWYENLAHRLNVPLIMFDAPFNHDEPSEHAIDFLVEQFKAAIQQLEIICKRKFDYDRFHEVMKISNRTSTLWDECQQMAKAIPSPIDGMEMFNYMPLPVSMRGSETAMNFFALLRDELAEKTKQGESAIGGEKYRILWDGIAIWHNLPFLKDCLRSHQACIAASTYPDIWVLQYDDLRSMAHAFTSVYLNRNFNFRLKSMERMVKDYAIDGVIIHSPRSCKGMSCVHYKLSENLMKATGVPVIAIDGDQTDPRHFSEAQFQTRVQALFEMIEGRKSRESRAAASKEDSLGKINRILSTFEHAALHPRELVKNWKNETGGKVVGSLPIHIPLELVHAAKMLPVGLWGGQTVINRANEYLKAYCCSPMKAVMENALNGVYRDLDAVVAPTTCDTMKCIAMNWKLAVPSIPLLPLSYPDNRKLEPGIRYLEAEFRRLAKDLARISGADVQDEALQSSIGTYQKHRAAMGTFLETSADHVATITPYYRHMVVKSSMFMLPETHTTMLNELTAELSKLPKSDAGKLRVVLSGIMPEPYSLLKIMDELGFAVVADDMALGSRQFRKKTPPGENPYERLSRQFADFEGCSTVYDPEKLRGKMIVKMAEHFRADGVIFLQMQFCDPEEYDYPFIKQDLEAAGIPHLYLEIEQKLESLEQVRTRLQTFSEILRMRK